MKDGVRVRRGDHPSLSLSPNASYGKSLSGSLVAQFALGLDPVLSCSSTNEMCLCFQEKLFGGRHSIYLPNADTLTNRSCSQLPGTIETPIAVYSMPFGVCIHEP